MKKLTLIGCLVIATLELTAAHLVGGEISYQCVGNNVYEVTLRIYRDCNSQGAPFDATAPIGIFKGSTLLRTEYASRGPITQLPTTVSNPCLTVPPNVCTEWAIYVKQIYLPPSSDGYTITYQRCCRNQTITNIPNPGTWGNTYTIDVPPNDSTCNSSPEFNSDPPIILCINDTLEHRCGYHRG